VLAGTVETAVNALWDARPRIGDRVTVVGAGMVGCCVAALLARFPGVDLHWSTPTRAGRRWRRRSASRSPRRPTRRPGGILVVHASATGPGLQRSLELLAPEGTVLELSWYGDHAIQLALGGAFHSSRLTIRSSQVGTVARPDRSYRQRLALALDLLRDPRFDALCHRAVAVRRAAVRAGRAGVRRDPRPLPPRDLWRVTPVFSVTVRDHVMIATASAVRSSDRPNGCTARRTWSTRRSGDPSSTRTTLWSTSARRPPSSGRCWAS
jgi:hypothetical protein